MFEKYVTIFTKGTKRPVSVFFLLKRIRRSIAQRKLESLEVSDAIQFQNY